MGWAKYMEDNILLVNERLAAKDQPEGTYSQNQGPQVMAGANIKSINKWRKAQYAL